MNVRGLKRLLGMPELAISATDTQIGKYLYVDAQGHSLIFTAGTPTGSTSGYAKGCLAIDYTNGVVYYNTGTTSSSAWTDISGGTTGTIDYDATLTDAVGTVNATLRVATQTVSTPVLTIPDCASVAQSFVFTALTQTLTNKTLTSPDINGGTADLLTSLSVKSAGAYGMKLAVSNTLATADRTLTVTLASDANQTIATPVGLTTSKLVGHSSASSAAQGEVLYHNGTAWALLGVGTAGQALVTAGAAANPYWGTPSVAGATSILNNATLNDAGANDAILSFTTQTVGAPTLTIPDFASVNDTFTFNTLAATLANKTLTTPKIVTTGYIADEGGDEYLMFVESATPANYITITSADALASPSVTAGGSDANIGLLLHGKGTGNVQIADAAAPTKLLDFELNGATAGKTLTLSASHTDDRTVVIPDASTNLVGHDTTQTLSGKTLTSPKIVTTDYIADAAGDELLMFVEAATPANYITVTSADALASPSVTAGGSDANIGLLLHGKGTGNVQIADAAAPTKILDFELNGATAGKTMTITSSQTDDRALTLPDATDTLVGKATTDIFTNKSFDCDGSGNALTNVNANELDPITIAASAQYGVVFTIPYLLTNQGAAVNIFNANAPFKFRVIDAWSINQSGDGGTWKLNDGAAGAGTDITDVVTVAASDKDIDRITEIDDAAWEIASSGSLSIVPDGGGALDCTIFVNCIRVD